MQKNRTLFRFLRSIAEGPETFISHISLTCFASPLPTPPLPYPPTPPHLTPSKEELRGLQTNRAVSRLRLRLLRRHGKEQHLGSRIRKHLGSSFVHRANFSGLVLSCIMPNFVRKYAFESSRRDLQGAHLCTVRQSHFLSKISQNFAKFCKIQQLVLKIFAKVGKILAMF